MTVEGIFEMIPRRTGKLGLEFIEKFLEKLPGKWQGICSGVIWVSWQNFRKTKSERAPQGSPCINPQHYLEKYINEVLGNFQRNLGGTSRKIFS